MADIKKIQVGTVTYDIKDDGAARKNTATSGVAPGTSAAGGHSHSVTTHSHGTNVNAVTGLTTTGINNYTMSFSNNTLTISAASVVNAYTGNSTTAVSAVPAAATLTSTSVENHSHTVNNHTHTQN